MYSETIVKLAESTNRETAARSDSYLANEKLERQGSWHRNHDKLKFIHQHSHELDLQIMLSLGLRITIVKRQVYTPGLLSLMSTPQCSACNSLYNEIGENKMDVF